MAGLSLSGPALVPGMSGLGIFAWLRRTFGLCLVLVAIALAARPAASDAPATGDVPYAVLYRALEPTLAMRRCPRLAALDLPFTRPMALAMGLAPGRCRTPRSRRESTAESTATVHKEFRMPHRPLLVLGNKRYSSWSLRPWLFLRHFGVDFDERVLALDTPAYASDIGALSPTRRVPVLHDGELVVWDSLAICEYANERWLGGRGWPAGLAPRALARGACAEMHSGFAALRSECPMNVCRQLQRPLPLTAAAQSDASRVRALWRELRDRHGAGGDFLFGRPGLVDAYFAPVVMRFWTYRLEADAVELAYIDAVRGLPAMREWIAAAAAEHEVIARYEAIGAA